ncbi:prolyl aminopeptidase [Amycolatopsis sp. H20-H5]|uniref:prolyl aminopeptidase n=1 Tax=Amycolatopsis sp. H20-H5 TaxID=3046309 RepID=UPI002DBADEC9|nr:prolyl aminopeptidase [Amycolatopsis sp. H20-H5]MEC3978597.1 prolyl aminopeptidase [Amycolatopsis sp. H20-H5]
MAERYPEIEPYEHGMLDVGDGNLVYWETCGNPEGKPAVVVHGGPGGGCGPGLRQYFDPAKYRVVLFDQRGCGRSTPNVLDPATDMSGNTTEHLLGDFELLREHLGIESWLLFGGSWGSTLGLVYAERNPHRVTEIVLVGVTTGRHSELDWITRGIGILFPEAFERFRDGVPAAERDGDLGRAYSRLLEDPDPAVRAKAAKDWCDWENAILMVQADDVPLPRFEDPDHRYAFARMVTHYFGNRCFLPDGLVLREAAKLAGIPAVLVHGRLDLSGPLITPWELLKVWPDAELVVIEGGGHSSGPGMSETLVAATDRFATRP